MTAITFPIFWISMLAVLASDQFAVIVVPYIIRTMFASYPVGLNEFHLALRSVSHHPSSHFNRLYGQIQPSP